MQVAIIGLDGRRRGSPQRIARRLDDRNRATERSGADSLTPSELRVARLAAEGGTNREIAQTLFVTPKTVEVHLSAAYRKLGIRSRTELTRLLVTCDQTPVPG